ncbi:CATRA system-associated protein [Kitasatospora phosalacinea]|uniref:CATRA system-associated protein n=1 Tax=Kitasatospora phosalacinea TaxID=2065 RepID=UPI0035D75600
MIAPAFDAVRRDALDLLGELPAWQLPAAGWQRVATALAAAAEAAAATDAEALDAALADLELAGPVRITRLGSTPVLPPPPPVRERTNHLVHALGGDPPQPSPQPYPSPHPSDDPPEEPR